MARHSGSDILPGFRRGTAGRKKGQLVFEFVIAALFFFITIVYVMNLISGSVGSSRESFFSQYLESKAAMATEVLLNSHENGIVREWPVLDTGRMNSLNMLCSTPDGYIQVLDRLELIESASVAGNRNLALNVRDVDGVEYVDCGRRPVEGFPQATITRFGLLPSGKTAVIEAIVW